MIRRILLGIGGTPFTPVAIERAVEICRLHDAQLTAVTVVDEDRLRQVGPVPAGGAGAALELREHRVAVTRDLIEAAVDSVTTACEESNVHLVVHREQGNPFELMVDYARYHDLSVFGLRSMFEYDVLGSADVKPADVLSRLVIGGVRPIVAVSERFRPIRRVLVAYGGSVRAAETMKLFLRLQPWPEVELRILSCGNDASAADRLLSDASTYCRLHALQPELKYRPGSPHKEILAEAAEWDADVIVLGTSRGSIFSRTVFGSSALEVIKNSDRPLFLGR
jgi:nucleotide-binding universal stress UspA family protein